MITLVSSQNLPTPNISVPSVTRKLLMVFFHFFIGPGPFPAVINMYGGINRGQVIEDKSAMFASRGIASLALAFFGVPDLPKKYVQ